MISSSTMKTLLVLIAHISALLANPAKEVSCERFENHLWKSNHDRLETCFIEHQKISAIGFLISTPPDQNITGLWFDDNKNLSYLPENISSTFPNVASLSAERCSLKAVGKENFNGLKKMKFLWLSSNSIEQIPSDTFKDLVELERIYLSDNKIQYMNGALFAPLAKLVGVDLLSNLCINESFNTDKIMMLADEVTKQCGTISETTMEHFISSWKSEASKNEQELIACSSRSESELKDVMMKTIKKKLEDLILQQKILLENFYKEDQAIKRANEKLNTAELEIIELRKRLEDSKKQ